MEPLNKIYKLFVLILIFFFVWKVIPFVGTIITMLVFSFLFATIFLQSVDYLERYIPSRTFSVILIIGSFLISSLWFIGSFISNLGEQIQIFTNKIQQENFITDLMDLSVKLRDKLPKFLDNSFPESDQIITFAQNSLGNLFQNILSFLGSAGNIIFIAFMILIFTVILLIEYHDFKRSLIHYIPNKYLEIGLRTIYNIEQHISKYLRGQILAAGSVAILSIIGLIILNYSGANMTLIVFIGIIAGLANLIPMVGPFVGMIPAILIALMNNLGNETAMSHQLFNIIPSPLFIFDIILMFLIVQQIDNNFITPILVGESVGIHPMAVMLVLLIGGTLIGPLGMLFAVPAAGIVKVIALELIFISKNSHLL